MGAMGCTLPPTSAQLQVLPYPDTVPLFEVKEDEAAKWAEMREPGRAEYVARHGLGWGAVMFTAFAVFQVLSGDFDLEWLVVNSVLWSVGGLLFGLTTCDSTSGFSSAAATVRHSSPLQADL